ncbi:phage baseplate assembly protein V [Ferrovibrio sp.]|uniref:phage baseplate assembly protein V n=1 Tax=Ferrovibrio sp. TaxID=1917215 RepID=UPI0035AE9FC6
MVNPNLLRPLRNAIALMLNRASVKLAMADQPRQLLQLTVLKGELRDGVEHWQAAGLSHHPRPGAQALVARLGGHSDHMVALIVDQPDVRPTDLARGESVLHNDFGHRLYLRADGTAVLHCSKLRVLGPIEATGDIKDRCDDAGMTMQAMRDVYNVHRHTETGAETELPQNLMNGGGA